MSDDLLGALQDSIEAARPRMTVDAALSIARTPSGWSETAKEKALRALAARVAELEAEREATGTEWGVGDPDDCASDEAVAIVAGPSGLTDNDRTYGRKLLRRDVRRGPWRPAS